MKKITSHKHGGHFSREAWGSREDCEQCRIADENERLSLIRLTDEDVEIYNRIQSSVPLNQRKYARGKLG